MHISSSPSLTVPTVGSIPPYSYLWYFIHHHALSSHSSTPEQDRRGETLPAVPAWVALTGKRLYKVGLDLGNSGPKVAMFDAEGRIVATHLPAVTHPVHSLAAGEPGTFYEEIQCSREHIPVSSAQQSNTTPHAVADLPSASDDEDMADTSIGSQCQEISLSRDWIGTEAIGHDGVSLAKGPTLSRFADARYPRFLLYSIAHLFEQANYASGDYDLVVAVGMPNEDIVDGKLDENTERMLKEKLCGKRWQIRITHHNGATRQYGLNIVDLAPGPQSYAGFYAWQYRPDGQPAQTVIEEIMVEDLGAYDLHELWIKLSFPAEGHGASTRRKVKITATRERKGDGIMLALMQPFARRLKSVYRLGELDDALAQAAFFSRTITVGGFREDLTDIVENVTLQQGAKVLTDVFKGVARPRSFYLFGGGGNALLRTGLVEKLTSLQRSPRTYLLLGATYATTLNAVGLLSILDQMCRVGHA